MLNQPHRIKPTPSLRLEKRNGLKVRLLPQAVRLLWLQHELRLRRYPVADIKRYLELFQNGDGGFGLRQGTTSFLDYVYHAMLGFSVVHTYPSALKSCREFILRSQSADGGFGRNFATVPTLENTYGAVFSLQYLAGTLKRGKGSLDDG